MALSATILTLYPEMFPGPLGHSLAGRALQEGLWRLETLNIRDFAFDKHKTVDDTPYGGGAGMVMKPDVVAAAIEAAKTKHPEATLIHFTPRGRVLTQGLVKEMTGLPDNRMTGKQSSGHPVIRSSGHPSLILLCGRFEGIDERLIQYYQPLEISIGDYVLLGGELAAMVLLEAMVRLLPGVVGNPETHAEESFDLDEDSALLLEYPHYTKPPKWQGMGVPEVLTSGNHARISAWRRGEAERITHERRPDIWKKYKGE